VERPNPLRKAAAVAAAVVDRGQMRRVTTEKSPERLRDPGFEIFTPLVPFRRISRSLSVTGGRPSREFLTSN